ncbi:MAG: 30S ribosomal protein S13 [bacterium]|nr:30S ribosomal protein S13 [bacterium]
MQRLMGIILPENKRIDYALTLIFGIGWTSSKQILEKTKIDESTRVKDITEDQLKLLIGAIEKGNLVEGRLREERNENIKRLREIGSYRGIRHSMGLPTRGQRTRSNARTKRGKRRTVGALSKEAWAKLEEKK